MRARDRDGAVEEARLAVQRAVAGAAGQHQAAAGRHLPAGQGGEGVEGLLLQRLHAAHAGEDGRDRLLVLGAQARIVQAHGRYARAHQGRGVGHDPDHGAGPAGVFRQPRLGNARGDGHQALFRPQPQAAQQGGDLLRLDGQHQVVGRSGHLGGVGHGAEVQPAGQFGQPRGADVVTAQAQVVPSGQAAEHGLAHLAHTQEADGRGRHG